MGISLIFVAIIIIIIILAVSKKSQKSKDQKEIKVDLSTTPLPEYINLIEGHYYSMEIFL